MFGLFMVVVCSNITQFAYIGQVGELTLGFGGGQ